MNNQMQTQSLPSMKAIQQVLMKGDLRGLNEEQKVQYFNKVCESVGLNPLTQPFAYIVLNGKETLYAKRDATDQLRSIHKVSVTITARDKVGDVYVVTAKATTPDGRTDESTGAVTCGGLKGDALANALMKAETKAKRRVTLSICGLGLLDETETETIPGAVIPDERDVGGPKFLAGSKSEPEVQEKQVQETQSQQTVTREIPNFAPGMENSPSTVTETLPQYTFKAAQKFKGKPVNSIDQKELEGFAKGMRASSKAKGWTLKGDLLDDVVEAEKFLGINQQTNEPPEPDFGWDMGPEPSFDNYAPPS